MNKIKKALKNKLHYLTNLKLTKNNLFYSLAAVFFIVATASLLLAFENNKDYRKSFNEAIFDDVGIAGDENRNKAYKNLKIKIEKINVEAPIVVNVSGGDENIYQKKLKEGVAHLQNSSLPAQGGNIILFGHSSANLSPEESEYAEIFKDLNNLNNGDEILIYYDNQKISYQVSGKEIVLKNDLSVLKPSNKEKLTLITCYPIGTDEKRLVLVAQKNDNIIESQVASN